MSNITRLLSRGSTGPEVKTVQSRLNQKVPVFKLPKGKKLVEDGIFGSNTDAAVRTFQKLNPPLKVDGIVGKNTSAALGLTYTGPGAGPAAPPRPAGNPQFAASEKLNGFDHTVNPPWQMVPMSGARVVRLMNGDGLTVVSLSPGVVQVTEIDKCFVHGGREFQLKGIVKGKTFVEARQGPVVRARLEVEVKRKKTVKLTFSFVSDNAGHKTRRNSGSVDTWVRNANEIMFKQANVELKKHNVRANYRVNQNLGNVVMWSATAAQNEWNAVVANRDGTADLNVFLVWEYEQDATPNVDNVEAGTLRAQGNCLIEDNIGYQTHETLAHEIGHYLGVSAHSRTGADLLMSPSRTANRISKAHATIMNP